MIVENRERCKAVTITGADGQVNESGRLRLVRELFRGRYRLGQGVRLREVAAKYGLKCSSTKPAASCPR